MILTAPSSFLIYPSQATLNPAIIYTNKHPHRIQCNKDLITHSSDPIDRSRWSWSIASWGP